jgi:hypothetical protein
MDLKKLIREVLENKDCCTATKPTKAPILNEGMQSRVLMTENMQYHIDNKKPLYETTLPYGSKEYLDLWVEARYLYSRGALNVEGIDKEKITETDLGEYGIFEGQLVPLDMPMLEEGGEDTSWTDEEGNKITLQDILDLTKAIPQKDYPTEKLAKIVLNWDDNPKEIERIEQVEVSKQYPILIMVDEGGEIQWILDGNHRAQKALQSKSKTIPAKLIKPSNLDAKAKKILLGVVDENVLTEDNIAELEKIKKEIEALKPSLSWIDSVTFSSYSGDLDIRLDYELDPQEIKQLSQLASKYNMNLLYKTGKNATLSKRRVPPKNEELNEINLSSVGVRDLIRRVSQDAKLLDFLNFDTAKDFVTFIQHGSLEDYYEIENEVNQYDSQLNEAEYQGRKVQLGKPMQGDIKKFKVYVKNAKGKVVKVNFGFGGKSAKGKRMVIKAKNPKRRAAYRARHHCDNPGPRWKANYWSCKKW